MLDKIYVSDIMTPRSVFFALDKELTVEEVFMKYKPLRFSHILSTYPVPLSSEVISNIAKSVCRCDARSCGEPK